MIEYDGRRMRVIDTQVHVWQNETAASPWPDSWRDYAHRGGISPTVEELIAGMDQAGVDHALLVAPTFGGDTANNDAVIAAAARAPDRFLAVGRIDLVHGTPDDVLAWMGRPGAAGIRLTFGRGASHGWLRDGTADWFWPVAEEHQVPVFVSCPAHVADLDPVLERHPNLRIALDHAGIPPENRPRPVEELLAETITLAKHPGLSVKASAFPAFVTEPYPYRSAQRWTRELVDAFGADRVFWGTDLTRGLPCTWAQAAHHLTEHAGLSTHDLELVLGHAVLAWLQHGSQLGAQLGPVPVSPSAPTTSGDHQ